MLRLQRLGSLIVTRHGMVPFVGGVGRLPPLLPSPRPGQVLLLTGPFLPPHRRPFLTLIMRGGAGTIAAILGMYVSFHVFQRLHFIQARRIRKTLLRPQEELRVFNPGPLFLARNEKHTFVTELFTSDPSGPMVITGPQGSGKTMIVKRALAGRPEAVYLDLRETPVTSGDALSLALVQKAGFKLPPNELLGRAVFQRDATSGQTLALELDKAFGLITEVLRQRKAQGFAVAGERRGTWDIVPPILAIDELNAAGDGAALLEDPTFWRFIDWVLFLTDSRLAHVVLVTSGEVSNTLDAYPGWRSRRQKIFFDHPRPITVDAYFKNTVNPFLVKVLKAKTREAKGGGGGGGGGGEGGAASTLALESSGGGISGGGGGGGVGGASLPLKDEGRDTAAPTSPLITTDGAGVGTTTSTHTNASTNLTLTAAAESAQPPRVSFWRRFWMGNPVVSPTLTGPSTATTPSPSPSSVVPPQPQIDTVTAISPSPPAIPPSAAPASPVSPLSPLSPPPPPKPIAKTEEVVVEDALGPRIGAVAGVMEAPISVAPESQLSTFPSTAGVSAGQASPCPLPPIIDAPASLAMGIDPFTTPLTPPPSPPPPLVLGAAADVPLSPPTSFHSAPQSPPLPAPSPVLHPPPPSSLSTPPPPRTFTSQVTELLGRRPKVPYSPLPPTEFYTLEPWEIEKIVDTVGGHLKDLEKVIAGIAIGKHWSLPLERLVADSVDQIERVLDSLLVSGEGNGDTVVTGSKQTVRGAGATGGGGSTPASTPSTSTSSSSRSRLLPLSAPPNARAAPPFPRPPWDFSLNPLPNRLAAYTRFLRAWELMGELVARKYVSKRELYRGIFAGCPQELELFAEAGLCRFVDVKGSAPRGWLEVGGGGVESGGGGGGDTFTSPGAYVSAASPRVRAAFCTLLTDARLTSLVMGVKASVRVSRLREEESLLAKRLPEALGERGYWHGVTAALLARDTTLRTSVAKELVAMQASAPVTGMDFLRTGSMEASVQGEEEKGGGEGGASLAAAAGAEAGAEVGAGGGVAISTSSSSVGVPDIPPVTPPSSSPTALPLLSTATSNASPSVTPHPPPPAPSNYFLGVNALSDTYESAMRELEAVEAEVRGLRGRIGVIREEISRALREVAGGDELEASASDSFFRGGSGGGGRAGGSGGGLSTSSQHHSIVGGGGGSSPTPLSNSTHPLPSSQGGENSRGPPSSSSTTSSSTSSSSPSSSTTSSLLSSSPAGALNFSPPPPSAVFLYGEGSQGDTLEMSSFTTTTTTLSSTATPFAYGGAPVTATSPTQGPFMYGPALEGEISESDGEEDGEGEGEGEGEERGGSRPLRGGHGHGASHPRTPSFRTSFSFFPSYDLEVKAQEQLDRGRRVAAAVGISSKGGVGQKGQPQQQQQQQQSSTGGKDGGGKTQQQPPRSGNSRKRGRAGPPSTPPSGEDGGGRYRWWL